MSDNKIRIGILGAADIAFRRFLPALSQNDNYTFAGVAVAADNERSSKPGVGRKTGSHKATEIVETFGGKIYNSYLELIEDSSVDALYIPLPPSLHYTWAKRAINAGKSIYMEKPFTDNYKDTEELIKLSKDKGVTVFENYCFDTHEQFEYAKRYASGEEIGAIRQIRCSFGFPYRGANDFRYDGALGGGAILDAGGYLMKCLALLTDGKLDVKSCELRRIKEHDIDGYGTALVTSGEGTIGILSFGMDQQYRCELELWGEKGLVTFNRIYTPAPSFAPSITVTSGFDTKTITIEPFDTFAGGINKFAKLVNDREASILQMDEILKQAGYVQMLLDKGKYE